MPERFFFARRIVSIFPEPVCRVRVVAFGAVANHDFDFGVSVAEISGVMFSRIRLPYRPSGLQSP